MKRLFAFLVAACIVAALVLAGSTESRGKAPGQCAAWGCHELASEPLAWTRPDGGGPTILSTGDLCTRHAAKAPFVFVTRFLVVVGVFPALLATWVSFRILYVVDQHGPGLPKFTGNDERRARALLFGAPTLIGIAWLAFFALRAAL